MLGILLTIAVVAFLAIIISNVLRRRKVLSVPAVAVGTVAAILLAITHIVLIIAAVVVVGVVAFARHSLGGRSRV